MAMLHAGQTSITQDSDGDFLPDVVEWIAMTNAHNPDTDGDGVCDYVEVVQRGNPHFNGAALPAVHEMRVVVSSVNRGNGPEVHLHLLFRFMGEVSLLTSLNTYFELPAMPGVRISLNQLATNAVEFEQRSVDNEGLWVRLTIPLASESVLRSILPFTLGATARIGTRTVRTIMPVFDNLGTTAGLVSFNRTSLAVQSLTPLAVPGNNRVCVLQLREVGSSPSGVVVEVSEAECVDYNDLNCGPACPQTVGSTFTIPGSVSHITGGG